MRETGLSRRVALLAGVTIVVLVAGAISSVGDDSPRAAPSTPSVPPTASPSGPIEFTAQMEPYPYDPAPPLEPTPVDGFYMRVFTVEEMGGYHLGIPVHCLRCVPYSVDAGTQTLLLYQGRFFLEHQINRFRALGHYVVTGDRIELFNDVNCSRVRGTYRWSLQEHQLTFDLIDDPCPFVDERSHDLTLAPWTRVDACHSGIKEWYPALVGC
jgi:hypothetical protein